MRHAPCLSASATRYGLLCRNGESLWALATFGYKHHVADPHQLMRSLGKPNFVMKIIPHVDGTPRICELVRYHLEDIRIKECWSVPAELQLFRHVARGTRAIMHACSWRGFGRSSTSRLPLSKAHADAIVCIHPATHD
jgi:acetoacetate decarboxylase